MSYSYLPIQTPGISGLYPGTLSGVLGGGTGILGLTAGGGYGGILGIPTDITGLTPLGQNLVPFQNGIPVVTDQNKQQAILDYLQTHAAVGSQRDAQLLVGSLDQLSPGELNLLFQNGTTYNFTGNDPTFRQNPNILGFEEDLNANGQRTAPSITINDAFSNNPQNSDITVMQDILHETSHALDASLATALNLPTEFAYGQSVPGVQALQNYASLRARGLVSWDITATDPTGRYPTISTEPGAEDLLGDAGKVFFTGGAQQLAQQDPATYATLASLLTTADAVGNRIVGF